VVCTLALARWMGCPVTAELREAVAQVTDGGLFDRRVFFVRPLGFCEPTPARRISYEDSLAFERVHEAEYLRLGFELVDIPPGPVDQRAALIDTYLRSWAWAEAARVRAAPGALQSPRAGAMDRLITQYSSAERNAI
jgi:hypothetical protein